MSWKTSLTLAAAAALVLPQSLGAEPVPERLLVVQYVALGIDLGDRIVAGEALTGEAWRATAREREALEAIRQRLESWDRYVVVNRLADAQLLLVVRQGRRASIGGGGGDGVATGGGDQPTYGRGVSPKQPAQGGGFSSPDDMLAAYEVGGSPSLPLWRSLASNGLSGKIPLFEAFRADVERAAARQKRP